MKTIVFMADATTQTPKPGVPARPGTTESAPPPPLIWTPFRGTVGRPTELLVLLVVILGLTAILFGWAFFFRRRSRRELSMGRGRVLHEGENDRGSGKRRRRKGHPDNRPRNPTLKERGGLPPPRDDTPSGAGPQSARPQL